ncbi:ArgS-related anticodon-binding protein NrtL [Streptomyces sp. NPDC050504]|uniref:ArgS-related anticodon-binding protein NrtL n=1 Tax=Streptomyces sp. NPDC050504 TaxID=3365618 RepID=UPI00378CDE3B
MIPAELSRTVLRAVRRAVDEGALGGSVAVPEHVAVQRPRPGGRGDYASSVALKLAGPAGLPPRDVAEILRDRVAGATGIERVDITGPGFLNFTLAPDARDDIVTTVLREGPAHGHTTALAGRTVRVSPGGPGRPGGPGGPGGDPRTRTVAESVVALLRAQGADASLAPDGERIPVAPLGPGERDPFERYGPDAARWALLRPAPHDRPHPGPHLLVQDESNPLFRVRHAHARARALLRNAADLGVPGEWTGRAAVAGAADAAALLDVLADHAAALESAARHRAPDRLARHLEAVADAFLAFIHPTTAPFSLLPLGDEKPSAAHRSRLALAEAAGTVLAGGLSLLGISAPEHL